MEGSAKVPCFIHWVVTVCRSAIVELMDQESWAWMLLPVMFAWALQGFMACLCSAEW